MMNQMNPTFETIQCGYITSDYNKRGWFETNFGAFSLQGSQYSVNIKKCIVCCSCTFWLLPMYQLSETYPTLRDDFTISLFLNLKPCTKDADIIKKKKKKSRNSIHI